MPVKSIVSSTEATTSRMLSDPGAMTQQIKATRRTNAVSPNPKRRFDERVRVMAFGS
jgi:hypothetical protein